MDIMYIQVNYIGSYLSIFFLSIIYLSMYNAFYINGLCNLQAHYISNYLSFYLCMYLYHQYINGYHVQYLSIEYLFISLSFYLSIFPSINGFHVLFIYNYIYF